MKSAAVNFSQEIPCKVEWDNKALDDYKCLESDAVKKISRIIASIKSGERRDKVELLQKQHPLPGAAQGVINRLINECMSA